MSKRFMVAAVFLVGCAVGGVSSQLAVPKASAQQAATLTKWEVYCVNTPDSAEIARQGNRLGAQGWEIVGGDGIGAATNWCWKRPKL
jgi:hypothetical protein